MAPKTESALNQPQTIICSTSGHGLHSYKLHDLQLRSVRSEVGEYKIF